ncbi:uncharacterized protein LOC105387681 [Plutella xylostella]|uniref:uncharacterized protein LOC105387681 n=1 Tax=Plutella xylostella TaxID=51655 RepID=UPI0005D0B37A|nr:uncharacterized protein LOC105387681 [Plutella xylostella]
MEQDLKRLIAARGQLKGTITRLYNFISNETEFNKDISVLDSQNCEDFERIENQYFAIMAAINEKLTPKTNCEVGKPSTSSSNLTKLPRIEIPRFSGQSNVQPFLRPWLRLAIAMLTLPE